GTAIAGRAEDGGGTLFGGSHDRGDGAYFRGVDCGKSGKRIRPFNNRLRTFACGKERAPDTLCQGGRRSSPEILRQFLRLRPPIRAGYFPKNAAGQEPNGPLVPGTRLRRHSRRRAGARNKRRGPWRENRPE